MFNSKLTLNTVNPTFGKAPEPFNGIDMGVASNVHLGCVMDSAMDVSRFSQLIIASKFIGIHCGTGKHMLSDIRHQGRCFESPSRCSWIVRRTPATISWTTPNTKPAPSRDRTMANKNMRIHQPHRIAAAFSASAFRSSGVMDAALALPPLTLPACFSSSSSSISPVAMVSLLCQYNSVKDALHVWWSTVPLAVMRTIPPKLFLDPKFMVMSCWPFRTGPISVL